MVEEGTTALIRHDTIRESPPYPRGGFLVREHELPAMLLWYFDRARIVALYEPLNPEQNGYNINLLFLSSTDAVAEVVGPGFDASDLQRGDLSPHETFDVYVPNDIAHVGIRLSSRISKRDYRNSVQFRREKLFRKAAELARNFGWPDAQKSQQCPSIPRTYCPIDVQLLRKIISSVISSGVIERFRAWTGVGFPLNFSSSFVAGGRHLYWDIVSPALKYDATHQTDESRAMFDGAGFA
jgi:hypothetical protein